MIFRGMAALGMLATLSSGAADGEFERLLAQATEAESRDQALRYLKQAGTIADRFEEDDPRRLPMIAAISQWVYHSARHQGADLREMEERLHRYQDAVFAYRERILAAAPRPKTAVREIGQACEGAMYHVRQTQACDCLAALIPDTVRLFGATARETAEAHAALSRALDFANRPGEAEASLSTAISIAKGETLADILEQSAGRQESREPKRSAYDQALGVRENAVGASSSAFAVALHRIADSVNDPDYSENLLRRRLDLEAAHRTGSLSHANAMIDLADFLAEEERSQDEADRLYLEGTGLLRQRMAGPGDIADALDSHSRFAAGRRQFTDAVALAEESLAIHRGTASSEDINDSLRWLAEISVRAGRQGQSEKYFDEFAQWARMKEPTQLIHLADTLGGIYAEQGDWGRAAPKYEVAVATQEAVAPNDTVVLAGRIAKLARVYQALGRDSEATRLNFRAMSLYFSAVRGSGAVAWRMVLGVIAAMMLLPLLVFGALQHFCARAVDNGLTPLYAVPAAAPVFIGPLERHVAEAEETRAIEPTPHQSHRAVFHGDGSTLFSIRIINLLLSILTLGTYFFWGKARVRRYVYGQTEYAGDRFAFLGHGREMMLGWLKSLPALAFVIFFPNILPLVWHSMHSIWVAQLAATSVLFVLWPIARVGAYRYRMNRTSWRGIRFSFRGDSRPYFLLTLKGYLLSSLTLGLYSPVLGIRQRRYIMDNTYFGDARFGFDGRGRDLVPLYFMALPLMFLTLGIYWAWWSALRARYEWAHTTFGEARFRCTATGGSLLRLWLGNLAILVGTLGFAMPWAIARTARYWTSRVELTGPVDLASIRQSAHGASAVGESFADFLGFDFGI